MRESAGARCCRLAPGAGRAGWRLAGQLAPGAGQAGWRLALGDRQVGAGGRQTGAGGGQGVVRPKTAQNDKRPKTERLTLKSNRTAEKERPEKTALRYCSAR